MELRSPTRRIITASDSKNVISAFLLKITGVKTKYAIKPGIKMILEGCAKTESPIRTLDAIT